MSECRAGAERRAAGPLAAALAITGAMFVLELGGGIWTRSLALMADAAHMAVDLVALALSLFASWAATLPADEKRSYGYHRAEVLAALGNGVGLWVAVGILLREAWLRIQSPAQVQVPQMILIATLGLACNLVSGTILYRGSRDDINVRAAFLHVFSDTLGSVGAIAAGFVMWKTGSMRADPVASIFICMVICAASFRLVRDSIHILLEGTPRHIDSQAVFAALGALEGVAEVHDLHLWSLSSGVDSMSGHLVMAPGRDAQRLLSAAQALLKERFGITHTTIQIEAN